MPSVCDIVGAIPRVTVLSTTVLNTVVTIWARLEIQTDGNFFAAVNRPFCRLAEGRWIFADLRDILNAGQIELARLTFDVRERLL